MVRKAGREWRTNIGQYRPAHYEAPRQHGRSEAGPSRRSLDEIELSNLVDSGGEFSLFKEREFSLIGLIESTSQERLIVTLSNKRYTGRSLAERFSSLDPAKVCGAPLGRPYVEFRANSRAFPIRPHQTQSICCGAEVLSPAVLAGYRTVCVHIPWNRPIATLLISGRSFMDCACRSAPLQIVAGRAQPQLPYNPLQKAAQCIALRCLQLTITLHRAIAHSPLAIPFRRNSLALLLDAVGFTDGPVLESRWLEAGRTLAGSCKPAERSV